MRLFVAVWPPPEVLDLVAEIDRPALAGVRWTTRDQWHVTLRFLGRMDGIEAAAARLAEAAAAVRGGRGVGSAGPVGRGGAGRRGRWAVRWRSVGRSAAGGSVASGGVVASAGPLTRCLGRSIVMLPVGGLDDLAATVVRLTRVDRRAAPIAPLHRPSDPRQGQARRQGAEPGRRRRVGDVAGIGGDPRVERAAPAAGPDTRSSPGSLSARGAIFRIGIPRTNGCSGICCV